MHGIHALQEKKRCGIPTPPLPPTPHPSPFIWQKHTFKGLLFKSIWVSGQEFVKNAEKLFSFLLYKC